MIKEITIGELKKMTAKEGVILQSCGGDLKEWEDGVNELFDRVRYFAGRRYIQKCLCF